MAESHQRGAAESHQRGAAEIGGEPSAGCGRERGMVESHQRGAAESRGLHAEWYHRRYQTHTAAHVRREVADERGKQANTDLAKCGVA